MQEAIELFGFRCSGFPFDTRINIFRILTEYAHVYLLRFFHRRNYASIPTHGTQAHIQIECLAQRHVQRTDTAADRCSQRSLNTYLISAECFHRFFRQPGTRFIKCPLTCQHFFPSDAPAVSIGFLQGCIHHSLHGRSDLCPYSVTCNKRYSNLFHILSCI